MAWSTGLPEPPGPMAAAARRMVPRSGDRRDPVTLRRSSFHHNFGFLTKSVFFIELCTFGSYCAKPCVFG